MKRLFCSLAAVLLLAGAPACGGSAHGGSPAPASADARRGVPSGVGLFEDRDGDKDSQQDAHYDADDYFGPTASTADALAIAALTERYYRFAAAANGAKACSLIYWVTAESLSEEYERSTDRALRGKPCAQIMTVLFRRERSQLRFKLAHMHVEKVMVNGPLAWIVMTFGEAADSHIILHREGSGWRLLTQQDSTLP